MKILVVEPGKHPYEKEIEGTLKEMQKIVGGRIQALYPFATRSAWYATTMGFRSKCLSTGK